MALPGSGEITTKEIYEEVYQTTHTTQEISLFSMANEAGISTTNLSTADFYGYSASDSVTLSYGSVLYQNNTDENKTGYWTVNHTGQDIGNIITVNFNVSFIESVTSVSAEIWSSINSTSSWTSRGVYSSSTIDSFSVPGVDYNDTLRIKMNIVAVKSGEGSISCTVTGCSFSFGTGTCSTTGITSRQFSVISSGFTI